MTPKNVSSSDSHFRSQPSVTCSSSVAAGADFHSMALTLTAAARKSASMEGGLEETEKYAKKRGWFHSVRAGKMVDWKSPKIFSMDSPCSGAAAGSFAVRSCGARAVATG